MKSIKIFSIVLNLLVIFSFESISQIVHVNQHSDTLKYEKLNQPTNNCKGLIVIFDYSGGNGITDIPLVAEKQDILVINIKSQTNKRWHVSIEDAEKFDACIKHAMMQSEIPSGNLIIGGFSGGGTCATRYTELIIEREIKEVCPKGLFIGDASLDYAEFYKYCVNELERECDAPNSFWGKRECEYIKQEYDSLIGDPLKNRDKYIKASPVTISEPDFGNAKYLLDIPVRSYHEVDPMWYVKERCRSILDQNIIVGSELINYLYNQGNKNAEIIVTLDEGYRKDGMRHPHSWSIIDPEGLLRWFNSL